MTKQYPRRQLREVLLLRAAVIFEGLHLLVDLPVFHRGVGVGVRVRVGVGVRVGDGVGVGVGCEGHSRDRACHSHQPLTIDLVSQQCGDGDIFWVFAGQAAFHKDNIRS